MIRISDIRPLVYEAMWKDTKRRYICIKGSRGSAKSYTAALWVVIKMMKFPLANTIVIRRYQNTLKDSFFSNILWAIDRLGVSQYWSSTTSPLEITYKPTNQKILFRGLDDATKITSIGVPKGFICWAVVEEMYELWDREKDFNKLDLSLRGEMPEGYFKRIIMLFNPWFDFWVKDRFFKGNEMEYQDENILAFTTTYLDNPYMGKDDRKLFSDLKKTDYRRYLVEGKGHWGVAHGLIYENVEIREWRDDEILNTEYLCGLDFGYSQDPTAFVLAHIDTRRRELYIEDTFGETKLDNQDIATELKDRGYHKLIIRADSSEPKSISELKKYGIPKVKGARKGADSILSGIKFLQGYKIIIKPHNKEMIKEFNKYSWEEKNGYLRPKPIDKFNHYLDALRYATEGVRGSGKLNTFNKGLLGL